VKRFLEVAQPFPGAGHGLATFGSANWQRGRPHSSADLASPHKQAALCIGPADRSLLGGGPTRSTHPSRRLHVRSGLVRALVGVLRWEADHPIHNARSATWPWRSTRHSAKKPSGLAS
jgi:hypothetical protein